MSLIAVVATVFIVFATKSGNEPTGNFTRNEGQAQNGGTATYDNYDWKELPVKAKKAAVMLGYTKRSWDNSVDPQTINKPWARLSKDQQKAAMALGYNERTWNIGKVPATEPPTSEATSEDTSTSTSADTSTSTAEATEEATEEEEAASSESSSESSSSE